MGNRTFQNHNSDETCNFRDEAVTPARCQT